MGLKIAIEPASPILGYRNLSMNQTNPMYEKADWTDLGKLGVPDGSVEELRVQHVIGKIHLIRIGEFLKQWANKLAPGGTLYIEAIDARSVGHRMAYASWDLKEMNEVVFGQLPILNIAIYSLSDIRDALVGLGLFIETAFIQDYVFSLTAKKPQ